MSLDKCAKNADIAFMRPTVLNPLFADTKTLPGIGPKLAALIEKAAGGAVVDVLFTLPHSIIDRSARPKLTEAPLETLVTLEVTVGAHEPPSLKKRPYRVIVSDETGFLTLVFFHAKADWLRKVLPEGKTRLISGRIEDYDGGRQMTHPDYIVDPAQPDEMPVIEPVYPLTAGLSANVMRKAAANAVKRAPGLDEWQDINWLKRQKWEDWKQSVKEVHSPTSSHEISDQSTPETAFVSRSASGV